MQPSNEALLPRSIQGTLKAVITGTCSRSCISLLHLSSLLALNRDGGQDHSERSTGRTFTGNPFPHRAQDERVMEIFRNLKSRLRESLSTSLPQGAQINLRRGQ